MSEMVERVARALAYIDGCKITGPGRHKASDAFGWEPSHDYKTRYAEANWQKFTTDAYVAISAMEEPTKAMLEEGAKHDSEDGASDNPATIWRVMIRKALEE